MARGPHNAAISWDPHVQLSWGGSLGSAAAEIWTNGLRFAPAGAVEPTPAQLDDMLIHVSDAVGIWLAASAAAPAAASFISTSVHLRWVKANYILASGLQRDSNTHVFDTPDMTGIAGNGVPFYQTAAVTFRTALKRGRAHSGRIYPPCVSATVGPTDGRFGIPQCTQMAQAAANLINNLNTNLSTVMVGTCVILSPGNTAKGTTPLRQNITSVEVDSVPDVQHRRTNRLTRAIGQVFAIPPA